MQWVGYVALGLIVGGLSGMFGIGGGVLLVPMLVFVMGFTQKEAQGTSLAMLSVPVVVFAAYEYYRRGHVQVPVVGCIIAGFVVGSYVAARSVQELPTVWLQRGFGLLLLYIGFIFLIGEERRSRAMLPAAVAAGVAWVVGTLWRRRRPKSTPTPSDREPDYHI